MNPPLVSVCLITYNHVNFIQEAIDGILMQKVNFPWELLIADDYSTDGTREILIEYQKKHSTFIKLILQEKNVGGAQNFRELINTPNGKYIAYIEGDDYWIDAYKLQKQADVMEANNRISLVYTNCKITFEDDRLPTRTRYENKMPEGKCLDKVVEGGFPQTLSILIRKSFLPTDIIKIAKAHYLLGDYPLFLYLALVGEYKYIPDITCVYRRNPNSTMETTQRDYKKNTAFLNSSREVLSDFVKEHNITDPHLLQIINRLQHHRQLVPFSMAIQNEDFPFANSIWQEMETSKIPIPFKYKLLRFASFLGPIGKLLIKLYYKK